MRLLLALLILCPLPAYSQTYEEEGGLPEDPPDCAIRIHHGKLHLLAAGNPRAIHINLRDSTGRREGPASSVDLEEGESGVIVRAAFDIPGPYWLKVECVQQQDAVSIYCNHTAPEGWTERAVAESWEVLAASKLDSVTFLRFMLNRAGVCIVDLDDPPPAPKPTSRTMALAETVLRDLDADTWATREAASRRLRDELELRAAVAVAAKGRKLTPEQRQRLATIAP